MSKYKAWCDEIQAARFNDKQHLGLGDIRLSRADGDRLIRDLMEAHEAAAALRELEAENRMYSESLANATQEIERLRVIRCPDGRAHRWDGDGQCKACANYATDLIDAALEGKG